MQLNVTLQPRGGIIFVLQMKKQKTSLKLKCSSFEIIASSVTPTGMFGWNNYQNSDSEISGMSPQGRWNLRGIRAICVSLRKIKDIVHYAV